MVNYQVMMLVDAVALRCYGSGYWGVGVLCRMAILGVADGGSVGRWREGGSLTGSRLLAGCCGGSGSVAAGCCEGGGCAGLVADGYGGVRSKNYL